MSSFRSESLLGRVPTLGLAVLSILVFGWVLPACTAEADDPGDAGSAEVLATVDGKNITRSDIRESAADEFEQVELQRVQCEMGVRQSEHQLYEAKAREMAREMMVEAEAAKRDLTAEELVAAEVESKIGEVSDADVDAWYEENKTRVQNRPKESIAPQIKQFLAQQKQAEASESFYTGLEAQYAVNYNLEPFRVDVASEGKPAKGPDSAPVKIVEFSDFECPYCSRVVPTVDRIAETYGDQVQIVFRQFPLSIHANAQKAGEASLCAEDQDKFWQMHDLMFQEQRQLAVADLKEKAERIGLDAAAFNECLDSGKYEAAVKGDMREGAIAGVTGTPAMFINGRLVAGAVPYEQIAEVIDEELERAKSSS